MKLVSAILFWVRLNPNTNKNGRKKTKINFGWKQKMNWKRQLDEEEFLKNFVLIEVLNIINENNRNACHVDLYPNGANVHVSRLFRKLFSSKSLINYVAINKPNISSISLTTGQCAMMHCNTHNPSKSKLSIYYLHLQQQQTK